METIEGVVDEIIYSNDKNGYTVCEIICGDELHTIVGCMPFLTEGASIKVSGKWTTHPEYGKQLKVDMYQRLLPKSAEAVERFLASGVIKGVGSATASKIVKKFGEKTLETILEEPLMLTKIKGINEDKALLIAQIFIEQQHISEVVDFFQSFDIGPECAVKLYKKYKEDSLSQVRKNPYILTNIYFNVDFRHADKIAAGVGIEESSPFRLSSAVTYILKHEANNGHTYLPKEQLLSKTCTLTRQTPEIVEGTLIAMLFDNTVYCDNSVEGEPVYLNELYTAEITSAFRLMSINNCLFNIKKEEIDRAVERVQLEEKINLAESQKQAVGEALINSVLAITGGPGTGKTTIIRCIIRLLTDLGLEVTLAAPTGRAAKRMTEATGIEAKTIHRLLEVGFSPESDQPVFFRNDSNPIEADVVILDEVSMVDIVLLSKLLCAIKPGGRLVLSGDVDQLPSVGPGNVLKDILACENIKKVKLTEIFRQAAESAIITNAHKINKGEYPVLNVKEKDFFFLSRKGSVDVVGTILELCTKRLPEAYGFDPLADIQVLTPMRRGATGVWELNNALQKALNKTESRAQVKTIKGYNLKIGDKVMQTRNNYELKWKKAGNLEGEGVFNGDMGLVTKIDESSQFVEVMFDDERLVRYDFEILDEIELSYAVTIHKSQGSEFPVVVIPLFGCPEKLLYRNLIYTAVTRAKKLVVLVGQEQVLHTMVDNLRESDRFSGLSRRLG